MDHEFVVSIITTGKLVFRASDQGDPCKKVLKLHISHDEIIRVKNTLNSLNNTVIGYDASDDSVYSIKIISVTDLFLELISR